jgi:quercetin dioxygenase-like cupin family protein
MAAGEHSPARHPDERAGGATFIHRADVIRNRTTNNAAPMRLWPLHATAEARMNYVEVAGRSGLHFHPDADHKLYVLEGSVVVTAGTNTTTAIAGDLIIIPKGVRHRYDVPAEGDRALLLTFDAPPYDPRKTVNVEPSGASK